MVTVILTREPRDNRRVSSLLPRGLAVLDYPCVATRLMTPSSEALDALLEPRPAMLVVTSRHAVEALAPRATSLAASRIPVAAVGDATAEALRDLWGVEPSLLAPEPTGASLGGALARRVSAGSTVLHFRGDRSTGTLAAALQEAGVGLREEVVYANTDPRPGPLPVPGPLVVLFASPSAATRFVQANPGLAPSCDAVAVGPTTAAALGDLGFRRILTARGTGPGDLAAAIIQLTGGFHGSQEF